MAVTDPYADPGEFRDVVGKQATGEDAEIAVQLDAVSRQIERELGRFFTQDAAAVARVYDGNGEERLWLPDDIASTSGLVVKVDLDGDYAIETTLTKDTDFWLGPANADKGPEPGPWEYLDVHPVSGQLSVWPDQPRAVEVTAKFGWPAVPGTIKELAIYMVRDWRARLESGPVLTLEAGGTPVRLSSETFLLLRDVKRQYGRGRTF